MTMKNKLKKIITYIMVLVISFAYIPVQAEEISNEPIVEEETIIEENSEVEEELIIEDEPVVEEEATTGDEHTHYFSYFSNEDGTHTITCDNSDCMYSEIVNCNLVETVDGDTVTYTCDDCGYSYTDVVNNEEDIMLSASFALESTPMLFSANVNSLSLEEDYSTNRYYHLKPNYTANNSAEDVRKLTKIYELLGDTKYFSDDTTFSVMSVGSDKSNARQQYWGGKIRQRVNWYISPAFGFDDIEEFTLYEKGLNNSDKIVTWNKNTGFSNDTGLVTIINGVFKPVKIEYTYTDGTTNSYTMDTEYNMDVGSLYAICIVVRSDSAYVTLQKEYDYTGYVEFTPDGKIIIPENVSSTNNDLYLKEEGDVFSYKYTAVPCIYSDYTCEIYEDGTCEIICDGFVTPDAYKSFIKAVYVEDSVEYINGGAFENCTNLEAIYMGNNVKSIGNEAFWGCSSLSKVSFPSSLNYLGSQAFGMCSSLKEVYLPSTISNIGVNPFRCCTFDTFAGQESYTSGYAIKDGALYDDSYSTLISYPSDNPEIIISPKCSKINDFAFNRGSVRNVDLQNVTEIGSYAFEYCPLFNDEKFKTGIGSNFDLSKVQTIGEGAFANCTKLQSLNLVSATSIGERAFSGCSNVSAIALSEGINGNMYDYTFYTDTATDTYLDAPTELFSSYNWSKDNRNITDWNSEQFREVESIAVSNAKTDYYAGNTFNTDGMVVTAEFRSVKYSGKQETVYEEVYDYTCDTTTPLTTYDTTWLVEYQFNDTQPVNTEVHINVSSVQETGRTLNSIEVRRNPAKTEYFEGDEFDLTGAQIVGNFTVEYNNGSTDEDTTTVSNDTITVSPNPLQKDTTEVIFTCDYNGIEKSVKYADFTVQALETQTKTLKNISITTQPSKTVYFVDTEFDTSGMVVTAEFEEKMNNGTVQHTFETVSASEYTYNPTVLASINTKEVIVSYTYGNVTKTAPVNVTVTELAVKNMTLNSLTLTKNPDKLNYKVGECFNSAGMIIQAKYMVEYVDGTYGVITKVLDDSDYVLNKYDTLATSDNKISVTYTYKNVSLTKHIPITVTQSYHTVTFYDGGSKDAQILKISKVLDGGSASVPTTPTKIGNTFVGWQGNYTNVYADEDIIAVWKPTVHNIIFKDYNSSVIKMATAEYGSAVSDSIKPDNPSRDGYTFTGWTNYTKGMIVTGDITCTAQYKLKSESETAHKVTFVVDGKTVKTQYVNDGASATAPSNPSKTGYAFIGWNKSFSNVTEDITVTAQFTNQLYTVTYKTDTSAILKIDTVPAGTKLTSSNLPSVGEAGTWTGFVEGMVIYANTTLTWKKTGNTTTSFTGSSSFTTKSSGNASNKTAETVIPDAIIKNRVVLEEYEGLELPEIVLGEEIGTVLSYNPLPIINNTTVTAETVNATNTIESNIQEISKEETISEKNNTVTTSSTEVVHGEPKKEKTTSTGKGQTWAMLLLIPMGIMAYFKDIRPKPSGLGA